MKYPISNLLTVLHIPAAAAFQPEQPPTHNTGLTHKRQSSFTNLWAPDNYERLKSYKSNMFWLSTLHFFLGAKILRGSQERNPIEVLLSEEKKTPQHHSTSIWRSSYQIEMWSMCRYDHGFRAARDGVVSQWEGPGSNPHWGSLPMWRLHVLLVHTWVFSRRSSFLPPFKKKTLHRLIGVSTLFP